MALVAETKRGCRSITDERIRRGKSMRELSKASGLSTAAISNIERGKGPIRPLSAQKICNGLGVEFDALFELVDSEHLPKDEG